LHQQSPAVKKTNRNRKSTPEKSPKSQTLASYLIKWFISEDDEQIDTPPPRRTRDCRDSTSTPQLFWKFSTGCKVADVEVAGGNKKGLDDLRRLRTDLPSPKPTPDKSLPNSSQDNQASSPESRERNSKLRESKTSISPAHTQGSMPRAELKGENAKNRDMGVVHRKERGGVSKPPLHGGKLSRERHSATRDLRQSLQGAYEKRIAELESRLQETEAMLRHSEEERAKLYDFIQTLTGDNEDMEVFNLARHSREEALKEIVEDANKAQRSREFFGSRSIKSSPRSLDIPESDGVGGEWMRRRKEWGHKEEVHKGSFAVMMNSSPRREIRRVAGLKREDSEMSTTTLFDGRADGRSNLPLAGYSTPRNVSIKALDLFQRSPSPPVVSPTERNRRILRSSSRSSIFSEGIQSSDPTFDGKVNGNVVKGTGVRIDVSSPQLGGEVSSPESRIRDLVDSEEAKLRIKLSLPTANHDPEAQKLSLNELSLRDETQQVDDEDEDDEDEDDGDEEVNSEGRPAMTMTIEKDFEEIKNDQIKPIHDAMNNGETGHRSSELSLPREESEVPELLGLPKQQKTLREFSTLSGCTFQSHQIHFQETSETPVEVEDDVLSDVLADHGDFLEANTLVREVFRSELD